MSSKVETFVFKSIGIMIGTGCVCITLVGIAMTITFFAGLISIGTL
jgi:hypothetical protein